MGLGSPFYHEGTAGREVNAMNPQAMLEKRVQQVVESCCQRSKHSAPGGGVCAGI